jgi:hypothetical protein
MLDFAGNSLSIWIKNTGADQAQKSLLAAPAQMGPLMCQVREDKHHHPIDRHSHRPSGKSHFPSKHNARQMRQSNQERNQS